MRSRLIVGTVGAISLFFVNLPAASASDDPEEVMASLIADVAPDQGEVVVGAVADDAVATRVDGTQVTVPLDPQESVVVTDLDAGHAGLTVDLPEELDLADGRVADDGTIVYHGDDAGASAAVQVLESGATRIQTVTPDGNGPHEFTYTFGDLVPRVLDDGTIGIVDEFDGGDVLYGTVDAAWAVDANGRAVETAYEIEDGALVQVIHPDATTVYPVVADPSVSLGWRVYVKYNKNETKTVSAVTSKAKYSAAICGIIPNAVMAAACGLVGYDILSSVASTFKSANAAGKCVQIGFIPPTWISPAILTSWNIVTC